ncbi:MAG TPA: efflux RND transporter periplasmic adaptor subunit [Pseudomonadales bacterium]|nr:efflux RND transporter periplasmic adaptor subunit [Pseudomonadales bacterium]
MNKLLSIAAPVVVFGLGIGGYALLHATKPAPEETEEPPRPVSVFVESVQRTDTRLDVVTFGEVRPRTDVELVAQVAGRVVSVSPEFTEGGRVEAGAALVVIDDRDHRLALQQARSAVAEAELGVQQALAAADVARKQLAGKSDPTPLALHVPQVNQARARLDSARARLEQAELDLERTRVSLPFEGRIQATAVDVGQYVTPGTPLGRAFAVDVAEVRLPFTDTQLASLGLPIGYTAGAEAPRRVRLKALVGGEDHVWSGDLVRIDAVVEPSTRLVYGLAQVREPYGAGASAGGMPLAVGLYVEAEIQGRRVADAQVIPRDALRAGNQVYVVDGDGLLQVRQVAVSHSDTSTAVIREGLAADEQVVVSSIRNPIDGMRLSPIRRVEVTADVREPSRQAEG